MLSLSHSAQSQKIESSQLALDGCTVHSGYGRRTGNESFSGFHHPVNFRSHDFDCHDFKALLTKGIHRDSDTGQYTLHSIQAIQYAPIIKRRETLKNTTHRAYGYALCVGVAPVCGGCCLRLSNNRRKPTGGRYGCVRYPPFPTTTAK